jgi:hypothetical protein
MLLWFGALLPTNSFASLRNQGQLRNFDHHLETMERGITWHLWRHLNGTAEERHSERGSDVYQATLGNVSPTDSVVLHHARIDEILKWTKEHLDAYLASAGVIIEQRDEPGQL